jgi:sulfate transport system ATP-binding protein
VVEHPATAFVMNFFGTVNVFRDHSAAGRAAYARPYEMDVTRVLPATPNGSVSAKVDDIRLAGAVVRVTLVAADGTTIHVEMTRDRFDRLGLQRGEAVFAVPKNLRVFVEP